MTLMIELPELGELRDMRSRTGTWPVASGCMSDVARLLHLFDPGPHTFHEAGGLNLV